MGNTAIIVGDNGQDGTLLKTSLEKQGIRVIGVGRDRVSLPDADTPFREDDFSIVNTEQVTALVKLLRPEEIYYLAAHHVSSEQSGADSSPAEYDAYHRIHVVGLMNFLTAIRDHSPGSRLFYAASSLVFNGFHGPTQNEETPLTPVGFYGLTKAQGILLCREFRQRHGVYAVAGILYNHESVLRPDRFLSKKLISAAYQISLGKQQDISVGNLAAETDWGYAPDYVEAFQDILRIRTPEDYVVATGESHSVQEFAEIVFNCFGLNYKNHVVEKNSLLVRHVPRKVGDSTKLKKLTGWKPSHDFEGMVRKLVDDYLESVGMPLGNKL